MKRCSMCLVLQPYTEFYPAARYKDGYQSRCKTCDSSVRKVYYENNREKVLARQKARDQVAYRKKVQETDPDRFKFYEIKTKYGLNREQWQAMYDAQEGKCAICKEDKKLVVDHCHESGKVHGLLCANCNVGIGYFDYNVEAMTNAIKYCGG